MGILGPRQGDIFRSGDPDGYAGIGQVLDGEESDPIKIGPSGRGTTTGLILLECGTGSGNVKWTMDSDEDIGNETATWYDWDKGIVTGTDYDTFKLCITGLKVISVSGTITFKIVI